MNILIIIGFVSFATMAVFGLIDFIRKMNGVNDDK
jgi:hypothetical protein